MAQGDLISEVAAWQRRLEVVHPESTLSSTDQWIVVFVLFLRRALWLDLLPGSTPRWWRACHSCNKLDAKAIAEDWKVVTNSLFTTREATTVESALQRFKASAKGELHYKWVLTSCTELISNQSAWDARSFGILRQWVVFDSKLNLPSVDLTTQEATDYLADEVAMSSWVYPRRILDEVARATRWLMRGFTLAKYEYRPRHGSGSSYELTRREASPHSKNEFFGVWPSLKQYLEEVRFAWDDAKVDELLFSPFSVTERARLSHVEFVPKSPLRNRVISKEPVILTFLQQDLKAAINDHIDSTWPWWYDYRNQRSSQLLALKGSKSGEYATLDLSKASDSVTCTLVSELFRHTDLLRPLFVTRSRYTEFQDRSGTVGGIIKLNKFAPMGSAVCFPVEVITFVSIICAAVRRQTGHWPDRFDLRVYGDDIVVRSEYVELVLEYLESLHFSVNVDKSFWDKPPLCFREACGIEACNGFDITPVRISRRFAGCPLNDDFTPGVAQGWVDFSNRLLLKGYEACRRALHQVLRHCSWYPYVYRLGITDFKAWASGSFQAGVAYPVPTFLVPDATDTNFRCQSRMSHYKGLPTWRRQIRVMTCEPRTKGSPHDSNDLFTWWCNKAQTSADASVYSDVVGRLVYTGTDPARWGWKWVDVN